jgi:hypothetical protein
MRGAVAGYRELEDPWSYGSALFGLVNICAGMGQAGEAVAAADELVGLSVRLGLPATSDYGIWHRVSLGRARLANSDVAGARQALDGVGNAVPEAARPQMALSTLLGQLSLAEDRVYEAVPHLHRAFLLWQSRPEPRDVAGTLWLAVAAARDGEHDLAASALAAGLRSLEGTDMERHDPLAGFASYVVTHNRESLSAARSAVAKQAMRFSDPEQKQSFETAVALHREIAAAWRGAGSGRRLSVRLARVDVPLGRTVRDDERIEVDWSLDDEAVPVRGSRVERRRRRLLALVEEARAAGAAPTDDQLAAALGVSRRTILRDVQALATTQPLATRRRRVSGLLSQK